MRSQKCRRVWGKAGWTCPVVSWTKGARGRDIWWSFWARAGLRGPWEGKEVWSLGGKEWMRFSEGVGGSILWFVEVVRGRQLE